MSFSSFAVRPYTAPLRRPTGTKLKGRRIDETADFFISLRSSAIGAINVIKFSFKVLPGKNNKKKEKRKRDYGKDDNSA